MDATTIAGDPVKSVFQAAALNPLKIETPRLEGWALKIQAYAATDALFAAQST